MEEDEDICNENINGYDLFDQIGEGSYGTVCKARYQGKIYAIKKQPIYRKDRGIYNSSYYIEASLLAQMNHPNIVKPYQYIFWGDYFYIIMPYYSFKLPSKQNFNYYRNLFYSLLSAGYYMEMNGIIHRDLKPANIIFRNREEGVLIDYGLGIMIYDEKQDRATDGQIQTYIYRAPEVYEGSTNYTSKIDVWSMGLILYELYTGERLIPYEFDEKQVPKRIRYLLGQAYKSRIEESVLDIIEGEGTELDRRFERTGVKGQLAELLRNMLKYDPQERFTFEQCLQSPLFQELPQVQPIILPFPYPQISPLNTNARQILLTWLLDVTVALKHHYRVFVTAVLLLDRFFKARQQLAHQKNRQNFQLYGIACFALAERLFDYDLEQLDGYAKLARNTYKQVKINDTMQEIFEALNFQLYCHLSQALEADPEHYIYLLVSGLITGVSRDTTSEEIRNLAQSKPDAIIKSERANYEEDISILFGRDNFLD